MFNIIANITLKLKFGISLWHIFKTYGSIRYNVQYVVFICDMHYINYNLTLDLRGHIFSSHAS
jgi:hypothetical protein